MYCNVHDTAQPVPASRGGLSKFSFHHLSFLDFITLPPAAAAVDNGTFLPTSDTDKVIYDIGVASSSQRAYYKSLYRGKLLDMITIQFY